MAPKVLVSDKLSPTAVQIFRDRGIEVDFEPDLGKDKARLAEDPDTGETEPDVIAERYPLKISLAEPDPD